MKLYRYEIYCEDEPQDVGFLVGVEDLGLSCEAEENLLYPFDSMLEIPDMPFMRDSVSLFTESGNRRFQTDIFRVAAAYEDSVFDVMLCTLDFSDHLLDRVVYRDEDQVCIPRSLYQETLASQITRSLFPPEDYKEGPFRLQNPVLIGDLYHVGTMDITRKSKFSHEWNGLSVSNCPDEWRQITEGHTHGDLFLISKPGLKLLDYYALTAEEKEQIQNWALDNDYVTPATLYKSLSWDEEGDEYYSLFDSYDAALDESDFEEDRVLAVPGLLPTKKLLEQSLVNIELLDVPDIITALYAEQVLDYDGIYWDEILDVASYSAPRGVIFNSKLSSFDVVNLTERRRSGSLDHMIQTAASHTVDSSFDTAAPER